MSIVIPTLNEENFIGNLFNSLKAQNFQDFETIVVDGGSKDRTVEVCKSFGSNVHILEGEGEFQSRNFGAGVAKGDILVFSCADVVFPKNLLQDVANKFKDRSIIAVAHVTIPLDASFILRFEYQIYNIIRYLFSKIPFPLKNFSTSTNFLAVRKSVFEKVGGFDNDINADGLLGRKLVRVGKTYLNLRNPAMASARRAKYMGFIEFNKHYLYMLENFIEHISKNSWFKQMKLKRHIAHKKMHLNPTK